MPGWGSAVYSDWVEISRDGAHVRKALIIAPIVLLTGVHWAQAQMFGPRALGGASTGRQPGPGQQPVSQPSPPTGNPATNTMLGLENAIDVGMSRFMRENRGAGAFVGRDAFDTSFVGSMQSMNAGAIESAVDSLIVAPPPNVNRGRPDPSLTRPGPYRPRLSIAFPVTGQGSTVVAERLETQVGRSLNERLDQSIQVEVRGRRAILSGVVASAHDRALAEQLVLLEPGVSEVENLLETRPSDSPAEQAP